MGDLFYNSKRSVLFLSKGMLAVSPFWESFLSILRIAYRSIVYAFIPYLNIMRNGKQRDFYGDSFYKLL